MILTGPQIRTCVTEGGIVIDPFDPGRVNPNSYNYRLGNRIVYSRSETLDSAEIAAWNDLEIPSEGLTLSPGRIYLANTLERIGSTDYAISLIGRSSIGRLGLFLQITADLGHVGSIHRWTLELCAVQPVRVYAGMTIGQVSFWRTQGEKRLYNGVYGDHSIPTPNLSILTMRGVGQ